MDLDMIVGSGGVLSHAPRRNQSMAMMIDAFMPEGVTHLAVDSIFMMPHLGVLSEVHPQAAAEVFERDCMIYLGACVAPRGKAKVGAEILKYEYVHNGQTISGVLKGGEMKLHPLPVGETAEIRLEPSRGIDVGSGAGRSHTAQIKGGVVGLVLDGRGRPLELPQDAAERKRKIVEWNKALDLYPA
jgi:hypothetical protein